MLRSFLPKKGTNSPDVVLAANVRDALRAACAEGMTIEEAAAAAVTITAQMVNANVGEQGVDELIEHIRSGLWAEPIVI